MTKANARLVRLKVIDHRSPIWMPREGVPSDRSECPNTASSMCEFVKCRYHLARVDGGEDGDRAGRPGLAKVARDSATGHTLVQAGDAGDERPGTTLNPTWIGPDGEFRHVPTCALDEIDRLGAMTNEQTGDRIGRHRTLAARVLRRAVKRLREEHSMTGDDLLRLVAPEARVDEEQSRGHRKSSTKGIR
jgi:hypothetical protein